MPFDGSGNFSPPSPPVFPAVSGNTVSSTYFNSTITDLTGGLSNCLTQDGQATWKADQDAGGYALKGLSGPVIGTDAATKTYVDAVSTSLASVGGASLVGASDGGSGSLWTTLQGFINKLLSSTGATVVGFLQTATGSVARTVQSKLREVISVKDLGAVGDGTTDDTTALQAALTYAVANACDLYIPAGTYIVQPLTLNSTSYAYMPRIYGSGRTSTILKKKAGSGTGPVLTIGAAAATNSMSGIVIEELTIDGLSTSASSSCIAAYNLVRSHFSGLKLKNADRVLRFYGGVSVRVSASEISSGNFGVYADSFSGSAGLNWPNGITIEGKTIIQGHATRGVYFNNGRMLQVLDCEIDTCGTSGNTNTSAIFVGSNIDSEDSGANPIGAIIERCWFEQCSGAASIVLNSGDNVMRDLNFGPNPNSTYDIYVAGGSYTLDGAEWTGTVKTPAIYETGGNIAGSHVLRCRQLGANNISASSVKTQFNYSGQTFTVATLPSPPILRARVWVSDSSLTAAGNFGALLTGGGANVVPVFFDGTNWRIG